MAQIIPIGQPVNDGERQAIAYLRDKLPADYRVAHNFELRHADGQWFEIDVAVIAPHAVYVVDVKSTYGEIHVAGGKWHPEGRAPFPSPVGKLRFHARCLHTLLTGQPERRELKAIWVEPVVLLTAADAHIVDPSQRDRDCVVALAGCERFFQDAARLPHQPPARTGPHLGAILERTVGKARPQAGLPLLGRSWQCEERLGANDLYAEYRASNAHVPGPARVRLRVYRADPYLPIGQRNAQRERIANAYTALNGLPSHPGIPTARDFFPTENNDAWVLVLDDTPGNSLRVHLDKPALASTFDQKAKLVTDLLGVLAHCHAHGVLHRAISPTTIIVGPDGQSRLTDFDYARPGEPRERTVAEEAATSIEQDYLAPEVFDDPLQCSSASDVYAAGVTIYELFCGERPFGGMTQAFDATGFPRPPTGLVPGLPSGFDEWLWRLCDPDAAKRWSAKDALEQYAALFTQPASVADDSCDSVSEESCELDYRNLPEGTLLANKYLVEHKLGKGGFGAVWRVIDTLGDVTRALKIIDSDRYSTVERMKQEYRTLVHLPEHPHVVRVFDGGFLNRIGTPGPYLVMEFVDGTDVRSLIDDKKLSLPDAIRLGVEVADGLAHLHANHVAHCDIKPGNLIWTAAGVKIIDFNVAVRAGDPNSRGGGTKRYLPPDRDVFSPPTDAALQERDVYALGVTLYEGITGQYPWPNLKEPPVDQPARDPREWTGFEDLSQHLVTVILRAIAPRRTDRFANIRDFGEALAAVKLLRQPSPARQEAVRTESYQELAAAGIVRPNTNPFVTYLLTLYSQSQRSNAGTRGLDAMGRKIYVDTLLDRALLPATLDGVFRLVLISGNAGDGKTAFIQNLEDEARRRGADPTPYGTGNGTVFKLSGRTFRTNYDGSQDEGDKINDEVLQQFFAPLEGDQPATWPDHETRIIAINEGRLVDFLEQTAGRFPRLKEIVDRGLQTGAPEDGVAVVNLNLRNVVAEADEVPSILQRLLQRLTEPRFWAPCENCDLKDRCYVHHNVRTFQNATAGAQVIDRLVLLYRLTTLRAKLHLTLRDLRSALAFTLVGTRDCEAIHELYSVESRETILQGFYFNSWMAAGGPVGDRLLRLLREVDVGQTSHAKLDRWFDFHAPDPAPLLMDFDQRGRYERELLQRAYRELPLDVSGTGSRERFRRHREYVAMLRRRHFFECRDESWRELVPYPSAQTMINLLQPGLDPRAAAQQVIRAINRGEGVFDTRRLRGKLALQVRQVDAATVRNYRVFPAERFQLSPYEPALASPYLEHAPSSLLLRYEGERGLKADLVITLDVFEMLERLNQGYRPTVDELQGYYLSLAVFKNILSSAPYQEILLTPSGHEYYSVSRDREGMLKMKLFEEPPSYGTSE